MLKKFYFGAFVPLEKKSEKAKKTKFLIFSFLLPFEFLLSCMLLAIVACGRYASVTSSRLFALLQLRHYI